MPAADRLPIIDALARVSYQSKDYPRAIKWLKRYVEEGGKDAQTRALLPNALYLTEDHAGVVKELAPQVQADAQAGRATEDVLLRMLAGSQRKVGDAAGYRGTLERIAMQGGKAEVWTELIGLSMQAANMGDRYKLDYYRLRQATAGLESADEFLEMAYLAQQAGLPGEADAVLKAGDARGMFGAGAAAQQARQLKQQVDEVARPGSKVHRRQRNLRPGGQGRQRAVRPGLGAQWRRPGRQGPGADDARAGQGRPAPAGPGDAAPGHRPVARRPHRRCREELRRGARRRGRTRTGPALAGLCAQQGRRQELTRGA